ncbi:MAG: type II toxin-antitoxin system RelE/ParE family toxin [Methylobacter sp.]
MGPPPGAISAQPIIVFYTPEARDDLQRLRVFIAEKNPTAAQKVAADLLAGIAMLKELPYLGRKVAKAPNPEICAIYR